MIILKKPFLAWELYSKPNGWFCFRKIESCQFCNCFHFFSVKQGMIYTFHLLMNRCLVGVGSRWIFKVEHRNSEVLNFNLWITPTPHTHTHFLCQIVQLSCCWAFGLQYKNVVFMKGKGNGSNLNTTEYAVCWKWENLVLHYLDSLIESKVHCWTFQKGFPSNVCCQRS